MVNYRLITLNKKSLFWESAARTGDNTEPLLLLNILFGQVISMASSSSGKHVSIIDAMMPKFGGESSMPWDEEWDTSTEGLCNDDESDDDESDEDPDDGEDGSEEEDDYGGYSRFLEPYCMFLSETAYSSFEVRPFTLVWMLYLLGRYKKLKLFSRPDDMELYEWGFCRNRSRWLEDRTYEWFRLRKFEVSIRSSRIKRGNIEDLGGCYFLNDEKPYQYSISNTFLDVFDPETSHNIYYVLVNRNGKLMKQPKSVSELYDNLDNGLETDELSSMETLELFLDYFFDGKIFGFEPASGKDFDLFKADVCKYVVLDCEGGMDVMDSTRHNLNRLYKLAENNYSTKDAHDAENILVGLRNATPASRVINLRKKSSVILRDVPSEEKEQAQKHREDNNLRNVPHKSLEVMFSGSVSEITHISQRDEDASVSTHHEVNLNQPSQEDIQPDIFLNESGCIPYASHSQMKDVCIFKHGVMTFQVQEKLARIAQRLFKVFFKEPTAMTERLVCGRCKKNNFETFLKYNYHVRCRDCNFDQDSTPEHERIGDQNIAFFVKEEVVKLLESTRQNSYYPLSTKFDLLDPAARPYPTNKTHFGDHQSEMVTHNNICKKKNPTFGHTYIQ